MPPKTTGFVGLRMLGLELLQDLKKMVQSGDTCSFCVHASACKIESAKAHRSAAMCLLALRNMMFDEFGVCPQLELIETVVVGAVYCPRHGTGPAGYIEARQTKSEPPVAPETLKVWMLPVEKDGQCFLSAGFMGEPLVRWEVRCPDSTTGPSIEEGADVLLEKLRSEFPGREIQVGIPASIYNKTMEKLKKESH